MYALFNSNDLNANGYEVLDIDASNPPKVLINKYQLARADGEVVTNQRYGERTISISGRILASNRKDMETKLDTLKTYFVGQDKNLDIYVADVTRRFVATCTGFSTTITGYHCEWTATFTTEAFGKAIATTSLAVTNPYITNPTNDAFTFLGTYYARPTFDLTVVNVDNYWAAKYLDIENVALNKKIRLTRVWNWYDRVVINGETKTCSLYAATKIVIDTCDTLTPNQYQSWLGTNATISLETTNMKEGVGCVKAVMAAPKTSMDIHLSDASAFTVPTTGDMIIPMFIPTPTSGSIAKLTLALWDNLGKYNTWDVTTQWNGSAIATNAWNYFRVDLASVPTTNNGTINKTNLATMSFTLSHASNFQLNGVLLDYITVQKAGVVATVLDYEGIFPEFAPGSGTVKISDEFTTRNFTYSASYTKRYL